MLRPLALAALLLCAAPAFGGERLEEADFARHHRLDQIELALKNRHVLRYLWADLYAAALYAPAQVSPRRAVAQLQPLRLELYYFREIDREDLIEAAWTTLRRQRSADALRRLRAQVDALHAEFRDIRPGDRYALNYSARSGLSLERNGSVLFSSADRELAGAYLGIWLAPDGLSKPLREALLADPPQ